MHYKTVILASVIGTLIAVLYVMGQWTMPFIVSLILAYCFHYPANQLSTYLKISSATASCIIVVFLVTIFTLTVIFLIPLIQKATIVLLHKISILVSTTSPETINNALQEFLSKLGIHQSFDIGTSIQNYIKSLASNIPGYLIGFLNTSKSIIYIIMFIFMIPIITFYLLRDWNKFVRYTKILLRRLTSPNVVALVQNINSRLAEYIKGQLSLCAVLSIIYCMLLTVIGVNESVVCGLFTGMISIIPIFGPFIGLGTTLAMSLNDSSAYQYLFIILTYLAIMFIDSNYLTPKFIGEKLGISPFWMLFSICATMSVFGTAGLFLAVPLTVVFATICKSIIDTDNSPVGKT